MRTRFRLIAFSILLLATACGPSAQELAPTIIAQTGNAAQAATAGVEQALSVALTSLALTGTPISTAAPSLTPTSTPDPSLRAVVSVDVAFIWSGPGTPFQIVLNANQGEQFVPIGWSADEEWLVVLLQNGDDGWIAAEQIQIDEQGANLPDIAPPPKPTPLPMFDFVIQTDRGEIRLTIHSTGKSYRLSEYNVHRLMLPGGWQTLTYSWSLDEGANCTATIYIDHDIQWYPPPSPLQFCASLPGGTNT